VFAARHEPTVTSDGATRLPAPGVGSRPVAPIVIFTRLTWTCVSALAPETIEPARSPRRNKS
jgi:hypothetical protein